MARPDLFVHTLKTLRRGRTSEELSNTLAECVDACRLHGKQASVTLTIKIKPERGMDGTYSIEDQIKSVIPEGDRGHTILFGTPDGNLTANDPNQETLELRDVTEKPQKEQPLREVN